MATLIGVLVILFGPSVAGSRAADIGEAIALTLAFIVSLALIYAAFAAGMYASVGMVMVLGIDPYWAVLPAPIIGYLLLCVPGTIEAAIKRRRAVS